MDTNTREMIETLSEVLTSAALDILGALAILVVGWMVAGWIGVWTRRTLSRAPKMDQTLTPFLASAARYAVLVFVIVAVLAQFGVQTTSIIAALGAVGLAIGLALQGTLSNIAAGIMLLVLRPFRIGEFVEADGIAGTVREIGLFATEFQTAEGVYLHVPNGTLLNRSIKNFSRNPTRRIDMEIRISYAEDVDRALGVARGILDAEKRLLPDPAPEVAVVALRDRVVTINLRCWVKAGDHWAVQTGLIRTVKQRFEAENIALP